MYVEKNGYIIMKKDEMSFIDDTIEITEEIDNALVYESRCEAEQTVKDLNEDEPNGYEIVNFHQTIWLDKMGLEEKQHHCCCKDKEIDGQISFDDINDFGIPMNVLNEVAKEKEETDKIIQNLIKENE